MANQIPFQTNVHQPSYTPQSYFNPHQFQQNFVPNQGLFQPGYVSNQPYIPPPGLQLYGSDTYPINPPGLQYRTSSNLSFNNLVPPQADAFFSYLNQPQIPQVEQQFVTYGGGPPSPLNQPLLSPQYSGHWGPRSAALPRLAHSFYNGQQTPANNMPATHDGSGLNSSANWDNEEPTMEAEDNSDDEEEKESEDCSSASSEEIPDYDADVLLQYIGQFVEKTDAELEENGEKIMARKFYDDYMKIQNSLRDGERNQPKMFKKDVAPMVKKNMKILFKDNCVDLFEQGETKPTCWRCDKTVRVRAKKSKVMHEMLRFALEIKQKEQDEAFKIEQVGFADSKKNPTTVRGFLLYFTFTNHDEVNNFLNCANAILKDWQLTAEEEAKREAETGEQSESEQEPVQPFYDWPAFERFSMDEKKFKYQDRYSKKKSAQETQI